MVFACSPPQTNINTPHRAPYILLVFLNLLKATCRNNVPSPQTLLCIFHHMYFTKTWTIFYTSRVYPPNQEINIDILQPFPDTELTQIFPTAPTMFPFNFLSRIWSSCMCYITVLNLKQLLSFSVCFLGMRALESTTLIFWMRLHDPQPVPISCFLRPNP